MKAIARQRGALDVADLQLVLALAESGSTVRASTVLHLTQSAVSRGLLAVEDKLGTRSMATAEIDLRDGSADGRITRSVVKCPACGHASNSRRRHCIYCGTEISAPHAFE